MLFEKHVQNSWWMPGGMWEVFNTKNNYANFCLYQLIFSKFPKLKISKFSLVHNTTSMYQPVYILCQCCRAGVVRSQRFLGGVGVGFLTTLGVTVGFFVQLWIPIRSFFKSHFQIGNSCWNRTISFETFVETQISCCAQWFPLILTAKFHCLDVKESRVKNFGKVGVRYFTSDSATLCYALAFL